MVASPRKLSSSRTRLLFLVIIVAWMFFYLDNSLDFIEESSISRKNSRRLLQDNGRKVTDQTRLAIINHLPGHPLKVFEKSERPSKSSTENLVKRIADVNHIPIESVENVLSAEKPQRFSNSNDMEAMPPGISSVKYLTVSRLSGPVSDPPEVIDAQQSDWWW